MREEFDMSDFTGWAGGLQVAKRHVEEFTRVRGYSKPNLRFVEGNIEYLDRAGIADESVDLIICSCVINLSFDKERILKEAYRVLAPGGELHFSDVYSSRRISETDRRDGVSSALCLVLALHYCLKQVSALEFCLIQRRQTFWAWLSKRIWGSRCVYSGQQTVR